MGNRPEPAIRGRRRGEGRSVSPEDATAGRRREAPRWQRRRATEGPTEDGDAGSRGGHGHEEGASVVGREGRDGTWLEQRMVGRSARPSRPRASGAWARQPGWRSGQHRWSPSTSTWSGDTSERVVRCSLGGAAGWEQRGRVGRSSRSSSSSSSGAGETQRRPGRSASASLLRPSPPRRPSSLRRR